MRQFILTLFILFQINSSAQKKSDKYNFDHTIIEVSGDLNKDNVPDKAIVTQDTLNENSPYWTAPKKLDTF